MTPKTDAVVSATSYTGAGASILAGITLTDWGIIVGIITALLTLALNLFYQHRKDRRQQRLFEAQMKQMSQEPADGQ
ncbi:holin [Alloalcanivorax sp. C16-1]|uniref:holin n=1 Tax=Alloalcanivorax sp. C16-1 TaxID=3390051 RepID=UPI0039710D57